MGGWIVIRVADQGRGFERVVPAPTDCGLAASGRGLGIYGLYADRVRFNDRGNRVALFRRVRR
jgi:anti-sigma regulatory factor (Ser/Thr protein kinase)